ncbi:lipid kinase [Pseudoroseomonas rhizosphaerae]|uniref:Lipid kinase n=1 Tax=Teichococcus rhizosphaerae TaxID=1335062 RepID=A0A2C7A9C2_9PROT|nr:lipid kinase [Pseudoroseomonas rhizosphaerae]PHK94233.1 lipid kinase [Pseudoroseomonas rhizosphaerae]
MAEAGSRALLIVNRNARNGGAALDAALAVLRDAGWSLVEHPCSPGQTAAEVIRARAAEGFGAVILGGGDGTLNGAAPALIETGLPFGILPLGTANDLARSLGIAPDPVQAAEVIAAGALRPIDLGEVNGRPFFNVASIGFSATLAKGLGRDEKKRWGRLGYALAAFRLLRRVRRFTAWITHDGVTEKVKTIQVSVGNGRHYGGGMTVESSATPDDGKLDVYSLELDHWWRLLALLPYLRRGTQGQWRDVRAFPTTACEVRTRRPMPVNTDGELSATTPARFRLLPRAVRVFAPPSNPLQGMPS